MFRHIIAATAVSLLATGAMAQNTINRAGTGPGETMEANSPTVDRLNPAQTDARWADYDRRMGEYETRLSELERWRDEDAGVVREGTYQGSTTDANQGARVDRVQPSVQ